MPEPKPAAFLSYVHFNDEHDDGRISRLRERLAREVQAQTGEEFPIFQDRDIEWGQEWRLRIEQALDATTFLIPVLTPSFFKSRACRDELERFLDREKKLKRQDLILPMYYIDCQLLSEPARRAADPLAEVLADRQYADWRELRHEPFTSPEVGKTLSRLAVQIRNALDRGVAPLASSHRRSATTSSKSRRRKAGEAAKPTTTTQPTTRTQEAHSGPAAKKEPPTHIVDPLYRGDFTSIGNAINAAKPGDRILVRPGLYREKLVIDKPLEILGEGERAEVVVEAEGGNVFRFETTIGRVANLTLRQVGSGNYSAVKIAQGRLDLEDCDVTSRGFVCVTVEGGADPRLRRNRIHHGAQAGILIENGRGTFEDNEILPGSRSGRAATLCFVAT